jgi:hypothetical protein
LGGLKIIDCNLPGVSTYQTGRLGLKEKADEERKMIIQEMVL